MKKILLLSLLSFFALRSARAADALLVPPTTEAHAGRTLVLTVYVNNPTAEPYELIVPDGMRAEVASPAERRQLMAVVVGLDAGAKIPVAPMSFETVKVAVVLPDTLGGTVSLRMVDLRTNAVMFNVTPAAVIRNTPQAVKAIEVAVANKGDDVELTTDREVMRRHISSYEPIYFALGLRGGANARFQFSFKYLIIGPNSSEAQWWRSLYLGYTQTSLWDLSAPSKPFYDTSYKPTLFYYVESYKMKPAWLTRLGLQAGIQHESNGKGAGDSRSLNSVYLMPTAVWSLGGPWRLAFSPRFMTYAQKDENADLARYRGNIEYLLRFGQDKGFQVSALFRKGNSSGYGSSEFDLTWPMRIVPGVSKSAGGYFMIQYFNGWGESLLDYNVRRTDQLRFGYSLTR